MGLDYFSQGQAQKPDEKDASKLRWARRQPVPTQLHGNVLGNFRRRRSTIMRVPRSSAQKGEPMPPAGSDTSPPAPQDGPVRLGRERTGRRAGAEKNERSTGLSPNAT